MEPEGMDRIFRKQRVAAAASGVLTALFCLLYPAVFYALPGGPEFGWQALAGGFFLLYAGPLLISGGICALFLRKLWRPPSGAPKSGPQRAVCFLAVFPVVCLAEMAASVVALAGLFLRGGRNYKTDAVRKREWERFSRSRFGNMVGAGQNAEQFGYGDTHGTGISLFGGLVASLGCLMLCSGFAEGKGPGRAFDRSLEIYVRLKKWFDRLAAPGRDAALLTPLFYGLFVIFAGGGAETDARGRVYAVARAFFSWLVRVEDTLPSVSPLILGMVLFLVVMPAVCLQSRHFFRCFLLACWNSSWEEKYREKLQRDGIAPNMETVDFPGT